MTDKLQDQIEEWTGGAAVLWVSDAAYQMKAIDRNIIADSSGNVVVLTLPPMSEAAGKFYSIEAPSGATADVSVNIKETATEIATYGDLNADDDYLLLFCTGITWKVVVSELN